MKALTCAPPGERASEVRIGRGVAAARILDGIPRAFFLLDRGALGARPDLTERAPSLGLGGGEGLKGFETLERVLRCLANAGIDRSGTLVAVGGGALGDLGGLAAALWLRGIDLVNVPTTLLAMLDSSVGGKTAINIPEGKNLVGQIWPASLVLIDPDFLTGLPEAEIRSGLGEALKVAVGLDPELFDLLEQQRPAVLSRDLDVLEQVIQRAVAAKIAVVEADVRESGPRRLLNLGHTLAHALEALAPGKQPHGVCVARGLHFALDVGEAEGALTSRDAQRCRELLTAYRFDADPLPDVDTLRAFIARDKKVEGNTVHFVLPTGIGRSTARPLSLDRLCALLAR